MRARCRMILPLAVLLAAPAVLAAADRPSASVVIVVDTSGSMAQYGRIEAARSAGIEAAIRTIDVGAEVALLAFDGACAKPRLQVLPFTRDRDAVRRFVGKLQPGGATPLSRAMTAANRMAAERPGGQGRMVILLADGADTCGDLDAELAELQEDSKLVRNDTIGLAVAEGSHGARQLGAIARASGGVYHAARSAEALARAFEEAVENMTLHAMVGSFGARATPVPTPGAAGGKGRTGTLDDILDGAPRD